MNQQQFLEDKFVILSEEDLVSEIDVFVNFCGPNIFTGKLLFDYYLNEAMTNKSHL